MFRKNFLICGLTGWCIEIIFTSLGAFLRGDLRLIGQTSLWMFPIYGLAAFIKPLYEIIKKLPLTTAFANKAVTVVWAILWGTLFFDETITPGRIFGAAMVIIGVILYGTGDREEADG